MRKIIAVVMIAIAAAWDFASIRWYGYVPHSTSPYDEMIAEHKKGSDRDRFTLRAK